MDAVKAFNAELSSLYEVKPPISKAKMTALTRGAIKAIKFYKHVVQSVEKFILKCKPEYKVPGLYVIDSIVRQSRHQFGSDKDVFAPRFAKNMQQTFLNLYKCPPEDKSKIIRVLNLWQKNQVFHPEVIQPLFDLADPNNPIHKELEAQAAPNGLNSASTTSGSIAKGSPALQKTTTKGNQPGNDVMVHGGTNLNLSDPNVLAQLQRILVRGSAQEQKSDNSNVHFDKKLLDFDYGDEDDEVNPSPRPPPAPANDVTNLLANPEVLRQLQTLQQSLSIGGQIGEMDVDKIRKLQEMKQQEDEFDKHLAQTVPNLPFASECEFKPSNNSGMLPNYFFTTQDLSQPPPPVLPYKTQSDYDIPQQSSNTDFNSNNNDGGQDVEVITLDHDDSGSNSPDGDRYNRRRRSRSRERSRDRGRDRRSRRSRSRSHSRRYRSRSRDRNRTKEREKESERDRERKKRGLPTIKKENLSVCSTTLWVGHLSKLVHQEDLSNTFGEFGDIVSIDLIPPRGCAFIVMHRRQDAARCLTKLKNHMMHGKAITLAWAPGKGVKGKDLKDYWEGDLGVSYIPWNKIKEDIDLEMLEDGGMIDEDTMPAWMKLKMASMTSAKQQQQQQQQAQQQQQQLATADMSYLTMTPNSGAVDTSQPPPMPGAAAAASLLQPPILPLVTPFQFNNRLLGPVSMMPNIPIGVPPPNLPTPMMPNQLLSIGSPFQQPPNLIQQQPQQQQQQQQSQQSNDNTKNNSNNNSAETNLKTLSETLMSMTQPFGGLMPQPPMIPSSSTAGSQPQQHQQSQDDMDIEMEDEKIDKPIPLSEQLQASMNQYNRNRDDNRDTTRRRDSRDRERRHSRERRTSGGGGRESRDRRSNRWQQDRGGDRRDSVDDRHDREKALNERLKEMAGMGYDERRTDIDRPVFEPPPPPDDYPLRNNNNDYDHRHDYGMPPRDDYDYGPQDLMMDGPPPPPPPPHEMMMDGPPMRHEDLMDGPPLPPDRFMRRRGGGGGEFRDDYDHRMRSGGGGGGDLYPPPLDDFGPPRPLMRGPPMMRPPGPPPRGFYPRGPPPMRGPRPGPPWKDRQNFNPRFDGPPDYYRGGPIYDDPPPPHNMRRGPPPRFDGRRRHNNNDFNDGQMVDREKRSRWSGNSSYNESTSSMSNNSSANEQQSGGEDVVNNEEEEHPIETETNDNIVQDNGKEESGNMTPLRDEEPILLDCEGNNMNEQIVDNVINNDEMNTIVENVEKNEQLDNSSSSVQAD